jgi:hypothetical protein
VRWLWESVAQLPPRHPGPVPAADADVNPGAADRRFPMHLREIEHASGGAPVVRTVLAEVYWADTAAAGSSTKDFVLQLISALFNLRHLACRAAGVSGPVSASALRPVIFASGALLCGPILALCVFALVMTAVAFAANLVCGWLHVTFPPNWEEPAVGLVGVGVAVGAGLILRQHLRDPSWRLLLWSLVLTGLAIACVVAGFQLGAPHTDGAYQNYLAGLLIGMRLGILLVAALNVLAFLAWVCARVELWRYAKDDAERGRGHALDAALGTMLLHVGLWTVVVPAIALGLVHQIDSHSQGDHSILAALWDFFLFQLLAFVVMIGVTLYVSILRVIWRAWYHNQGNSEIPRLLVNWRMMYGLIVVSVAGSVLFLWHRLADLPGLLNLRTTSWPLPLAAGLPEILVSVAVVISLVGLFLRRHLAAGIHVLMDVANHFYRPDLAPRIGPDPDGAPAYLDGFSVQQRIEARMRRVLEEVLALYPNLTHVTVVSHSQGTVIAVDVLWLDWTAARFAGKTVHLITMGSPISHLYQYYLPHRYEAFDGPSHWGNYLRTHLQSWVNLYRCDDFVGMTVNAIAAGFPANKEIPGSGHFDYWGQQEVAREVVALLP